MLPQSMWVLLHSQTQAANITWLNNHDGTGRASWLYVASPIIIFIAPRNQLFIYYCDCYGYNRIDLPFISRNQLQTSHWRKRNNRICFLRVIISKRKKVETYKSVCQNFNWQETSGGFLKCSKIISFWERLLLSKGMIWAIV